MTTATQTAIHDGYFTVITGNTHRTFRIHTQPKDASFAPGKQVIGYLHGPDNGRDYRGFGFILDGRLVPWKRFQTSYDLLTVARFLLESDGTEAGKEYAKQSGNCWVCNRMLTTPESIAAGIGPTCASRI